MRPRSTETTQFKPFRRWQSEFLPEAPEPRDQLFCALTPLQQSVPKKIIQLRNPEDFLSRWGGIVFNSSKFNLVSFENYVTAPGITVSRLTNASHIDHQLLLAQRVGVADFTWRVKPKIFGKNARYMGMSLETIFLDKAKNPLDFSLIINVFGKNVLV